jgi:hypothetical protein
MTIGDFEVFVLPQGCSPTRRRDIRKHVFGRLRSARAVILDLSTRESLNHDDIDFLLDCAARAEGGDTRLSVVSGTRSNHVLLEVTRIASVLPIFSSVAEAAACPEVVGNPKPAALPMKLPLPRSA